MKKFLSLIITLLASVSLLIACSSTASLTKNENLDASNKKNLTHNLRLLVTSDIHSGVNDNFTLAGVYEKRKEYEEKGDYTLLIDDGDVLQGTFLSSISKGSDLIDIINTAGYDILTFGNHEFDYGMEKFMENTEKLNNKYISCNFTKNGELVFDPYVIKEFDNVKFAFIGINTPETLITSKPKYFEDENGNLIYGFYQDDDGKKLYKQVQDTIDKVKNEGADYVIAVAHIGEKETSGPYRYNDIISNTSGFDVFLDGHSHDSDQVNMKDKNGKNVFRMGVGTKLSSIGVVTFTPAGTIEHELLTYENPTDETKKIIYNNPVSELVAEKNKKIDKMASEVIGKTDFPLTIYDREAVDSGGKPIRIVRRMETNLGDLVADAYRVRTNSDIAFVNGGGVRVNVDEGDITIADIKNVQPFENTVCMINVTGQQILDALEWGAHNTPAESGGFLQVSGMTFTIDTAIKDPCQVSTDGICLKIDGERRIKNLMINGEPVDVNKKYRLSTLSYTALDNGDGFTAFDGCEVLEMGSAEDYTLVIDYIKENLGGVIPDTYKDPYGNGRIEIK